jgi:hypothetical protein
MMSDHERTEEFVREMNKRLDWLDANIAQIDKGLKKLWEDFPWLNPFPPAPPVEKE